MVFAAAATGVICTLAAIGLGAAAYWMFRMKSRQQNSDVLQPPPPPLEIALPPAPTAKKPAAAISEVDVYQTVLDEEMPSTDSLPWLEGIGGVISGQKISIHQEETLLGRSRVCDVQIQDPKVSRQHALLRLYNGRYFIQDMQSSRGTLVNSRSVETHLLNEGDEIRLGDSTMVFHLPRK